MTWSRMLFRLGKIKFDSSSNNKDTFYYTAKHGCTFYYMMRHTQTCLYCQENITITEFSHTNKQCCEYMRSCLCESCSLPRGPTNKKIIGRERVVLEISKFMDISRLIWPYEWEARAQQRRYGFDRMRHDQTCLYCLDNFVFAVFSHPPT